MAITLLQHIQQINEDSRERMAKNQHLWIGLFTEDIEHWKEYGITTPEEFDQYLDDCVEKERRKDNIIECDDDPYYPGDRSPARPQTYSEEDVFVFLDGVRESGVTNMYGASPYIREEFECTRYEANRLLAKWMETFGERHND